MDDEKPRRPRAEAEPAGLSPVRAFVLLGVVAAALAGGIAAATREAPAPEPGVTPRPSPDYSLTDAEAIAEFERLNDQLMQAYRERNIALAEDVFTSDSPMLPRVRKEIQTLIDSSRLSATRFVPKATRIVSNGPTKIEIARTEILFPKFETEGGRDATAAGRPHRQELTWTLQLERSSWLLHEAVVTDVRPLQRGRGS